MSSLVKLQLPLAVDVDGRNPSLLELDALKILDINHENNESNIIEIFYLINRNNKFFFKKISKLIYCNLLISLNEFAGFRFRRF